MTFEPAKPSEKMLYPSLDFVLSGMATVYLTDLFFGQWTLCTLLAGFNLSSQKIVLDIEIVTTKGSKLVILIKNC